MSEKVDISAILEREGVSVLGTVIRDSGGGDHSFVYIPVHRNGDGHQVPSNRSLHRVRDVLKDQGIVVEFILTDAQTQNIEAGVRATLLHAFGDDIRNVFLSMETRGSAIVWVEQKNEIQAPMKLAIAKKAAIFLKEVELELKSVLVTNDENLPGKLAFLKAVRQVSPADLPSLTSELMSRGFSVPSDDWLKRKLDTLRKSEAIVRLGSGHYVLLSKTVEALGTVRAGRSPDVSRLLALARKCK